MSNKDVLSGATVAYTAYFDYVRTLINEIGKEKALAYMAQSDTARGTKAGAEIKAQAGGKDFSAKEAIETIVEMAKGVGGIDEIIEKTDDYAKSVTAFGKCPVYEAGKAIGMEDEEIETLCRASSLHFLDSVVRQLNPNLCYKVTAFRSEKDKGCVEEIVRRTDTEKQ
ncbi:MAG: L-2-amino-thiazoline-4-carboxylic acid hydrolase [Lachnospiraceae bacterium]|nr:L-2-amino-thiazoline-4-carboxylic acid hydrolase [Lachnospiraceae bacterium]